MQIWKYRTAGALASLFVGVPLVLALSACGAQADQGRAESTAHQVATDLAVQHDAERGVTCWSRYGYTGTTLSCLPDWMLTPSAKVKP